MRKRLGNFADTIIGADPVMWIVLGMIATFVTIAIVFFPEVVKAVTTAWDAVRYVVIYIGRAATR